MTQSPDCEFVDPLPKRYARRSSIHHPQLRDLLMCPEGDELYFVVDRRVDMYNLDTRMGATAMDLVFRPYALTVKLGQLVVCGPAGELVVRSLHDAETVFEGKINSSINNGCTIATNEVGVNELLVASNAHCVHTFNLDTMMHESDVMFPACMNYCAVSRDGAMMVAVGDTEKVFLCDARNGYARVHTFGDMKGYGFGCTFDWSTRTVSAASQNGEVVVWDIRNMKVLNTFYAKGSHVLSSSRQACRQVKYSPSSLVDLMAFTEQTGSIHVVDGRNYQMEQVIEVDPEHRGIAGMCFSPDGSKLYAAVAGDAIYGYQVDSASRRRFADGSLI